MTAMAVLKNVRKRFPGLRDLPKGKLRIVEEALMYAAGLGTDDELISEEENRALLKKLELRGGITPANSLKVYRIREQLTQEELAKRSGIPQSNISAMEKGKRPIGLRMAKRVAKILRCDYKKLV